MWVSNVPNSVGSTKGGRRTHLGDDLRHPFLFFWCGPFLKSLLNLWCSSFRFLHSGFWPETYGISPPWWNLQPLCGKMDLLGSPLRHLFLRQEENPGGAGRRGCQWITVLSTQVCLGVPVTFSNVRPIQPVSFQREGCRKAVEDRTQPCLQRRQEDRSPRDSSWPPPPAQSFPGAPGPTPALALEGITQQFLRSPGTCTPHHHSPFPTKLCSQIFHFIVMT